MQKLKIIPYILSTLIVLLVGYAGSLFTTPAIQGWYATLIKPSFNPPNWIFGPVWASLYLLIGVSLGIVISSEKTVRYRKAAIISSIVQLILNLAWSYFFFYLHNPGLAVLEIFILLASIVFNIYYSAKVNKIAAVLLVPYLLWVSFATILTISIWRLN